jgi:hypothetical protein
MLKKLNKMLCFFGVTLLATSLLWSQVAMEVPASSAAEYAVQWPAGPLQSSVPEWAKPGCIRFCRWDGGAIETAKAFLSGWPGFNPPIPDYVYTMTNWYDPRTVALLREASFNVVWVTFSNGFSIPTERAHQEQVRRYIDECHRQGIHVMAYESIGNMFWEDMYEHVPESRNWVSLDADGKPVPYGAGDYAKMGRVTRYMADLSKPEWRDYLKKRIDLAIDAGADGVMYDNNFGTDLVEVYQDIYRYASARKRDFLLMGNFHRNTYVLNRLVNCLTTEDGIEPGVWEDSNDQLLPKTDLLQVGSGFLVNNIGLLRIHTALSDGWKAMMVENGRREKGERETGPMSASRYQLSLAESMMFGIASEGFVEGTFAHDLFRDEPEAKSVWRAMGRYNRFFADNEEYYVGARSLASLAVILDDSSEGVELLNGLASRNVIYDVLYEHELTPAKLKPYAAVALLTTQMVRDRALKALAEYLAGGGKVVAAGNVATQDERGSPRPRPSFLRTQTGRGECTYYEKLPPMDDLARVLLAADRRPQVSVVAPKGVLYNVVEQPKSGRVIVHLLNYTLQPVRSIQVTAQGDFGRVTRLTPDTIREPVQVTVSSSAATEVQVPSLEIYSILVFDQREEHR